MGYYFAVSLEFIRSTDPDAVYTVACDSCGVLKGANLKLTAGEANGEALKHERSFPDVDHSLLVKPWSEAELQSVDATFSAIEKFLVGQTITQLLEKRKRKKR